MFDREKLDNIISEYKDYLPKHFVNERYKWEAIKHFQDNWNIEAENFAEMFKKATAKTYNLLASVSNLPRGMIIEMANADGEAVRTMFEMLFDESQALDVRIDRFIADAEQIRLKYGAGIWKSHFQSVNAVSTYLWLRFPDKYYIYKYSEAKLLAKEISNSYIPRKGAAASAILEINRMYDEIRDIIIADDELKAMLQERLTDKCYKDDNLITMVVDLAFFTNRFYGKSEEANKPNESVEADKNQKTSIWKISHGTDSTGISKENRALFESRNVIVVNKNTKAKGTSKVGQGDAFVNEIKKGDYFYLCYGNEVVLLGQVEDDEVRTNAELGDDWCERSFKIIAESKNCEPYKGIQKWWTPNANSTCIEILEKEYDLFEEQILNPYFDMTVNELIEGDKRERGYWWLIANPKYWSYSDISVGETQDYTLYNANGNKRRIFKNFLEVKAGDYAIGYEASPIKKITSLAKIIQGSDGERIYFEKVENLTSPIDYSVIKDAPELAGMEFMSNQTGSLFKLTKDEYDFIMDIIREENPIVEEHVDIEPYTKEDFLSEVFMDKDRFNSLEALIRNKLNVILQGAPGVGKTFAAKRLAYAMMGEKDNSRIEMVQFHQNYTYEDFVMGYRPDGSEFKLTEGIFYRFCQKASNDPDREYFFIIDEINRGNMSKILGELMMLIEKDYRGTKLTLAYNGMSFSVPKNVFIIGMMNTADRSLAMIDYALRRRFSFFEVEPGFNSDGFRKYQDSLESEMFNTLIGEIKELNLDIANDDSLGKGFCIGHSYVCGRNADNCTEDWMQSVVEYDIIPMLSEYWFDDSAKTKKWSDRLHGVF